jgi:hypothetical protein
MLRANHLMISAAAAICISQAHAECASPQVVTVPDGATATSEEMVEAQTHVKQYMAEMELYLDCLDQEEAAMSEPPTDEIKQTHTKRHNTAVDTMETVAIKFNEQVRVFKKANP